MLASHYTYSRLMKKRILIIIDQFDSSSPTMTVTNNIEEVLEEISQEIGLLTGYMIVYRDTDGVYDGVDHDAGVFKGFYRLGEFCVEQAIKKYAERKAHNEYF